MIVDNAAPLVEAGEDQTVLEGEGVHFSGSFTDQGVADTHAILWDFGDGETAEGSLQVSHTYAKDGVYIATLQFTDDDGGEVLISTTFSNWDMLGFRQAYPRCYPDGDYPSREGALASNMLATCLGTR